MDRDQQMQIEQKLRSQWNQIYPQILDRFTTVSRSDLDSARSADDLVRRIADKSQFSERYVETEVSQLVGVGGGQQSGQQPFGQPVSEHQQQGWTGGGSTPLSAG